MSSVIKPINSVRKILRACGLFYLPSLHRMLAVVLTFVLVCLAWVFFIAQNIGQAWYVLTHMDQGREVM